ncbi:TetR/AcrR family transcriptional regulator [Shimia sagamensis]|uniref:Transcriptional regulator, TetR family n=1 Tax=Shimia sagamensis TaxID=1566352 RepID=A0ABY1P682_9RHOB|nr:TetR/AcrR family transcriptional regulator [Shimia sagamensis]SMP27320.1 transcriptional regulator, TetR family [Shimia sagamensis]
MQDTSIKARLIDAGKTLFADRGYAGASVREICKMADASSTMIHHYFGTKEGLFNAIIDEFTAATFDVPLRLISKPPKTAEEMRLRLEMFISETFRALISQAPVFRILVRENRGVASGTRYHEGFAAYLSAAQVAGFVDAELEVQLITGLVLDRLGNQIMYAATMKADGKTVLNDEAYAEEWLAANTRVLLFGLAGEAA